ncbi:efflux RND transporter periplasmic adaptor subunit [Shewanella colwelliana]|uniref:efflux RND transporter periplasmic adaptor subunit n=1 Tax=Shewanella colwelliana TaxID=23 RepID=UPI0022AFC72F|nr:efflux RND transporter periplasmic adaptor subunit [Shewanella colwelliana]MCZ4336804.1 efflux RND transporter periplasmic adaptor subunit [Shewanella colwelliana]
MKMFNVASRRRVALLALITGTLSACQPGPSTDVGQIQITKVASNTLIEASAYEIEQQFTGNIRSGNTTAIGFELAGKINQLAVDSGNSVKQGQLLAQLDTSLLLAEKQELEASLAQNSADLDLANSTLNRSLELNKQGYTSEQTLDELKGQLNSLKAARQRLRASIAANQLRIEKSTLTAPFDGVIAKRNNNLGEVVALGSPLFTLIQLNNPQAIIGVPVNIAQALNDDQKLPLRVNDTNYSATVAGIGAEVNPVTRTVPVRFTLPTDAQVINGELAYLNYGKRVEHSGYWIPLSSLTDGLRGLWNIYVLVEEEKGQYRIERRDIEILYTRGEQAYITGAIRNNEMYVTHGLHKLVVGEVVTLNTDVASR